MYILTQPYAHFSTAASPLTHTLVPTVTQAQPTVSHPRDEPILISALSAVIALVLITIIPAAVACCLCYSHYRKKKSTNFSAVLQSVQPPENMTRY